LLIYQDNVRAKGVQRADIVWAIGKLLSTSSCLNGVSIGPADASWNNQSALPHG
jgi:hypothetical protein